MARKRKVGRADSTDDGTSSEPDEELARQLEISKTEANRAKQQQCLDVLSELCSRNVFVDLTYHHVAIDVIRCTHGPGRRLTLPAPTARYRR